MHQRISADAYISQMNASGRKDLSFVTLMSRNACNGETGEKSPASGDLNWMPKVAPWRLAILAKIARGLVICGKIFKLNAKSGPFKVDNERGPYNCEATTKKKFKLLA